MIKSNFHTHSIMCDGKSTLTQMVSSAIEKDFTHLGFSGHSFMENAADLTLTPEKTLEYYQAVNTLKGFCKDKLVVLCGIEQDCFSVPQTLKFDYSIGSVHNIKKKGELLFFDFGIEETQRIINEEYSGRYVDFAKDYFETVGNVIDMTGADVIGHMDLCSKFNEKLGNAQSDDYLRYAEDAVKKLVKTGKVFEINTGAMARGYRTQPYPSKEILKMIYDCGGKIMINSDCHDHRYLDFGFDAAEALALETGFKEHYLITEKGFKAKRLGE